MARGLQTTGNKFVMSDFQIVNGCQTSHVIFNEREQLTDMVYVPVKIVATEDEDIVNAIVTATNRQTQVTQEDLYALAGFQKKLEAFLSAYPDKKRLFYERRSKQYNAVSGIEKVRIITKPRPEARAFAAMFIDDPHRASRYYADLRTHVGERIFNEQHKLEPYYTAAYAQYKLEFLFRNGSLPVYYKPARYHLLMAIRYIAGGPGMPDLKANKVQSYCNTICEVLWNDTSSAETFKRAIEVVNAALRRSATNTRYGKDAELHRCGEESIWRREPGVGAQDLASAMAPRDSGADGGRRGSQTSRVILSMPMRESTPGLGRRVVCVGSRNQEIVGVLTLQSVEFTAVVASATAIGGIFIKMAYDSVIERISSQRSRADKFLKERKAAYDDFLAIHRRQVKSREFLHDISLIIRAHKDVKPGVIENAPPSAMSDLVESFQILRRLARYQPYCRDRPTHGCIAW